MHKVERVTILDRETNSFGSLHVKVAIWTENDFAIRELDFCEGEHVDNDTLTKTIFKYGMFAY